MRTARIRAVEGLTMSDSWSGRLNDLKSRIKEVVNDLEGDVDAETVRSRIGEAVGKAASDVDTSAVMASVKEAIGKAEGKVDAEKLKQWASEVDTEKLKGWLDEAKTRGAGAAALVSEQGEKLTDRAPGALDKVLGAAKERIGELTGDEQLAHAGELDRLKGDIKERLTDADDQPEGGAKPG